MRYRVLAAIAVAAGLSACATGPSSFPVQATRFHYNAVTDRGSILIEPLPGTPAAGPEYRLYADAVQQELLRTGYTLAGPGTKPDNLATVAFTRTSRALPRRRSPITIGVGGSSYSGGYSGGVGVGGGVSFPLGGGRAREGIVTDLSVRIRHGADAVWEGHAQSLTDTGAPGADAPTIAARLASALFTGFPGDSGRTIEVK